MDSIPLTLTNQRRRQFGPLTAISWTAKAAEVERINILKEYPFLALNRGVHHDADGQTESDSCLSGPFSHEVPHCGGHLSLNVVF